MTNDEYIHLDETHYNGTALVTDACSQKGVSAVARLAHSGYDLVLVDRDATGLRALAEALTEETGRYVQTLVVDADEVSAYGAIEMKLSTDARIKLMVRGATGERVIINRRSRSAARQRPRASSSLSP